MIRALSWFHSGSSSSTSRERGVRPGEVLMFNRELLTVAVAAAISGAIVSRVSRYPQVRVIAAVASAIASYFIATSSVATWWVFQWSGLTRYEWLTRLLDGAPRTWLNVTTGFDDTTSVLAKLWPDSEHVAIDVFDSSAVHDRALKRARSSSPPKEIAVPPRVTWPIAEGSMQAALLLMAAHEMRGQSDRFHLAAELARVVSPGGHVIIVEHTRDIANALAFGPGVFHFETLDTWRKFGSRASLSLVAEESRTPFVRVLKFERD